MSATFLERDRVMTFTPTSRAVRTAAALLLAMSAICMPTAATVADDAGKPLGDTLYSASFKDLNDQPASLAQFKGKVLLLYFWATWCVPCRAETPNLVKLNEAYKGKAVTIVGVALDGGDKVRTFVKDNNVTYPILFGGHDAIALGRALGNEQGGIPFTVVVDKNGTIVRAFNGDLPNDELEKIIDPLIG